MINHSQLHRVQTIPELMQHLGVRQNTLVGQPGELSPRALLGQKLHKQVKRMHRCEQVEQEHSKKLRGTKQRSAPASPFAWEQIVNGLVIKIR